MRILHLSDFHFQEETSWDSSPVLVGLTNQLHQIASQNPVDFIAITGDIAFSGKEKEYDLAMEWFDALLTGPLKKFPRRRLLMVPGNHDVSRSTVGLGGKAIHEFLLEQDQVSIAKVLQHDGERQLLLSRLASYQTFVVKLRKVIGASSASRPWWAETFKIGRHSVGFAGYCTCWLCGKRSEQGDLLIGRLQLHEVYRSITDADFKIALTHHPLYYLRAFDAEEVNPYFLSKFNLHLRGHLHRERAWTRRDSQRGYLELAAGSCYAGSDYSNAFHVIDIDLDKRELAVTPYLWQGVDWIRDRNLFSKDDGIGYFSGF